MQKKDGYVSYTNPSEKDKSTNSFSGDFGGDMVDLFSGFGDGRSGGGGSGGFGSNNIF